MKKLLFLILFAGLSASGADSIYAIVKGTNVLAVWQYDTASPPRALTNATFAGSTNVPITEAEHFLITPGWSYKDGVFRDKNRQTFENGTKLRIDRSKLIDAAIADMVILQDKTVKATWDAMAVSNKLEVVRIGLNRLGIVTEKLLVEKRNELFELKEAE